ncbi:Single-stranded DNA-binding protein 3, partial [Dissostichus eleginoides]
MYAKGKSSNVPSDNQARENTYVHLVLDCPEGGEGEERILGSLVNERLALYVYEYLLHVGAQKSAQTFLSE